MDSAPLLHLSRGNYAVQILLLLIFVSLSYAGINIPVQDGVEPPALLSQTGLFEGEVKNLVPSSALRPFDIIQPLWVDFAQKQRFLYLPEGEHIRFSPREAYEFPLGTVLVKHFKMEISKGVFQNIETRLLVKKAAGWIGYTYLWAENDASLVTGSTSPVVTLNIDATAIGGARTQKFNVPNRGQCLQCHSAGVGFVRGVQTLQLNRLVNGENQLEVWNREKVFDRDIAPVSQYGALAPVAEASLPLEERVRSYLSVNCAHCHNPDPKAVCGFTGMDFRYDSFNPENLVASGHLVKGKRDESMIFERMSSVQKGVRMPYIGSVIRDEEALDAVGKWIDSLGAKTENMAPEKKLAHFLSHQSK